MEVPKKNNTKGQYKYIQIFLEQYIHVDLKRKEKKFIHGGGGGGGGRVSM